MVRLGGRAAEPMVLVKAAFLAAVAMAVEQMPDPCAEGALTYTDNSAWADVLRGNVKFGSLNGVNTSLVNYKQIRKDPSRLKTYMRQLCNVDLNSMPILNQLALLANAYNALMVAMVVHYNPGKDVREIGGVVPSESVWKDKVWTLAGNKVSLEVIEHEMIREIQRPTQDRLSVRGGVSGRIHTSIVCGSLSCPSLLEAPFEGATLVEQITENTRRWLLNPTKNQGPVEGGVILSSIFKWFTEDFVAESGSVEAFLRTFAGWTTEQVPDGVPIAHMDYNWGINALNASGKPISGARGMASTSPLSLVASAVLVFLLALTSEPKRC